VSHHELVTGRLANSDAITTWLLELEDGMSFGECCEIN